ncbi:MAG: alpha/beta hydrolase-fold protein, partial [Isosphaeraceae bacterium]
LGLHQRRRAIFAAPSFAQLPWYADHPTDPDVRQESHFLHAVLPSVEKDFPARREPNGRLLLGFSKSGWGAFSLLLRHPNLFGKAAAWDAPLMMERPGRYGSGPIFGTPANFEGYRLTRLVEKDGRSLGESPRLIHLGRGNFQAEHAAFERLMTNLGVPHRHLDGPVREHRWESGWLSEAVEALLPTDPNAPKSAADQAR